MLWILTIGGFILFCAIGKYDIKGNKLEKSRGFFLMLVVTLLGLVGLLVINSFVYKEKVKTNEYELVILPDMWQGTNEVSEVIYVIFDINSSDSLDKGAKVAVTSRGICQQDCTPRVVEYTTHTKIKGLDKSLYRALTFSGEKTRKSYEVCMPIGTILKATQP